MPARRHPDLPLWPTRRVRRLTASVVYRPLAHPSMHDSTNFAPDGFSTNAEAIAANCGVDSSATDTSSMPPLATNPPSRPATTRFLPCGASAAPRS